MNQELKQQVHKEFDEIFTHDVESPIHSDFECCTKLKSFIDYLIDKTVQHERERIVGIIKEKSYMNDFGDTVIDDIDNLIKQIENYE